MVSQALKKHLKKLSQKKYRQEFQECIVEGVKGVNEVLVSGLPVQCIIVQESRKEEKEIQEIIKKSTVEVYLASEKDVKEIKSTDTFPGILAVISVQRHSIKDFDPQSSIICLDGVKDPGNLGTIIRTADWFGIKNILLSEDCVDYLNDKVVRSTMGSLFRTKIVESNNLENDLEQLRKSGYTLIGFQLEGKDARELEPSVQNIYIFGSESHGIRPSIAKNLDSSYTIKAVGEAESLNVAVSAGIILYQISG